MVAGAGTDLSEVAGTGVVGRLRGTDLVAEGG